MQVAEIIPGGKFNQQQLDILKMFAAPLPQNEWDSFKEMAMHFFADKVTRGMDQVYEEDGWNDEKIQELLKTPMRFTPQK